MQRFLCKLPHNLMGQNEDVIFAWWVIVIFYIGQRRKFLILYKYKILLTMQQCFKVVKALLNLEQTIFTPGAYTNCLSHNNLYFTFSFQLFIGENLTTSYLTPYLKSMGSSFTNGANFAVGGGKTFPRFDFFNLGLQSVQFFWFQNQSIELTSKGMASNYIFIYLLLFIYIYIYI